ncbi:hypothetical protein Aduo_006993 [Ancylostoma duodenale]
MVQKLRKISLLEAIQHSIQVENVTLTLTLFSIFKDLRECLGDFYEKCFDYDTILDLSDNKKDALQYTRELETIEFNCDNDVDYDGK